MEIETSTTDTNQPSENEISSFLSATRKQFEGSSPSSESTKSSVKSKTTDKEKESEIKDTFESKIVIPGDVISEIPPDSDDVTSEDKKGGIILGPGLSREGSTVYATKCGVLRKKRPLNHDIYWIDTQSKRYVPVKGEYVLGIVVAKAGDAFRVDIGAAEYASLSYLAFEGATKKNRPLVNLGDVVYARLIVASRDMEAELVCVDSYGKRAGMGVIGSSDPSTASTNTSDNSLLFTVPLNLVRKLLSKSCVLLNALGKYIAYEIAVGMNGRIWIRGKTVRDTICLANAISVAEHMTNEEITRMSNKLVDVLSGF